MFGEGVYKSISFLGENLQLKGENKEKISLNLLLIFTIEPLIFNCCLGMSHSVVTTNH